MKTVACSFLFLVGIVFVFAGCSTTTLFPSNPKNDWTVMVFMNGDNDLEGKAWQDLNSMEMVGSTDRAKILVQMDTTSQGTYRYLVTQDTVPTQVTSKVLESLGRIDMGDYQSIVDFVRFAVRNYPASRYALILWNHGGGFRKKDISFDFSTGNAITIPQLAYALSQVRSILGKELDLLGMDACLMAMVEVAYEVRNYAHIMVASEKSIPGEGWDYRGFLQTLASTPSLDAEELARIIVDTYVDSYPTTGVTLSTLRLKATDALAQNLHLLSQMVLSDNMTPPILYSYVGDQAIYFDDYDFVDLGNLLELWQLWPTIQSVTVKEQARKTLESLQRVILYNRNNLGQSLSGLSVYFPSKFYDPKYNALAFASSTSWDDMLKHFFRYK